MALNSKVIQESSIHQLPKMYRQLNGVDCGPIVLHDAAMIVRTQSILDPEWTPAKFRICAAVDISKGEGHFMTTDKDPLTEHVSLTNDVVQNRKMAADFHIGPLLDDVAVTKGLIKRFTQNERLNTCCMNAALHLFRKKQQGCIKIALLDCYFNQRAASSNVQKAAHDYLTWMAKQYGEDFDFAELHAVWIPMYLPDPDVPDGEQAHWWRLLYDIHSGQFSRACPLGNEKSYLEYEERARAFLELLMEVSTSLPCPLFLRERYSLEEKCTYLAKRYSAPPPAFPPTPLPPSSQGFDG
jgi:hypothetical protein